MSGPSRFRVAGFVVLPLFLAPALAAQLRQTGSARTENTAPPPVVGLIGSSPTHTLLNWKVVWSPAAGVKMVHTEIQRWLKVAPDCCRASGIVPDMGPNYTPPSWIDYNLPLSGVYVYRLTTVYSDGSRGTAQFEHTRPEPQNPDSLTAVQIDPTSVRLTWPEAGAVYGEEHGQEPAFYQVWGPGIANTGMTTMNASRAYAPAVGLSVFTPSKAVRHYALTLTGIPAGLQSWSVGSFYEPATCNNPYNQPCPRVSTVGTAFPRAALTVVSGFLGLPPSRRPPE